ncbi:MAG: hypothetical protein HOD92_19395 [Deltaproteobacteria bacterium]|jgi:hypothetical protein|nr:hypothetical protein [Deltaproteobacteria bacterium]MBT4526529.1 hypothetical protein [Deltaproteobacteria bacterium]
MEFESLKLTKVKLQDKIHLTSISSRQKAAKKKLATRGKDKGLKSDQVSKFLENRLKRLYERVKINGALTNDKVSEYLSMFTSAAIPVLGDISSKNQEKIIKNFATTTKDIVDKISGEGFLEPKRLIGVKLGISRKSRRLIDQNKAKRAEIVDDIGIDISKVSEEAEKNVAKKISTEILNEKIIPIGFSKKPDYLTVEEFLQLPLGERKLKDDEGNFFKEHILYLEKAVEDKLFPAKKLELIRDVVPIIEKIKFKKYFQIFVHGKFEEPTFMAVISLWANNALKNLKE